MKCLLTFFLAFSFLSGYTQYELGNETDSLRKQLSIAKEDTARVNLLTSLAEAYRGAQPDSARYFAMMGLELSQQVKYYKGEAKALLGLSVLYRESGDLAEALNSGLRGLEIAIDKDLPDITVLAYLRVGNVYASTKNFTQALNYFKQAEILSKVVADSNVHSAVHLLTGNVYEQMNMLDSASYHAKLIQQKSDPIVLNFFGNIESKRSNYNDALRYYGEGINLALEIKNYRAASNIYIGIASLYKKLNKTDSAVYFAKQGLMYGQQLSYYNRILAAADLLSELYDSTDAKEALKYYRIARAANDSLYGRRKVEKLQAIMLNEQQRQQTAEAEKKAYRDMVKFYGMLAGILVLIIILLLQFRNNKQKQKANTLLRSQKEQIEKTLGELKATQKQLIQSEKMASLGELTAGIAHEIQNPLNFVNNFSEVSSELVDEIQAALEKNNTGDAIAITADIKENLQKITYHGNRADSIVRGMLQHSRTSSGKKEPTDINALAEEYLRLSYHGMRAKDKSLSPGQPGFNANFKTDLDSSIEKINIAPQEMGRVFLNLFSNAFYSVVEKKKHNGSDYQPLVTVSSNKENDKVVIRIKDNGMGIPKQVLDKIYQPFFTTKPTGQGTGLGLSMTYDIIRSHGGEINAETVEGEFAEFIIRLPLKDNL